MQHPIKHIEVMCLSKKRRQVRRQRIHKGLALVALIALDHGQVVIETVQSQSSQAADQTAVDHVLLRGRQRDTRVVLDHRANPQKLGTAEFELLGSRGHHGPCP